MELEIGELRSILLVSKKIIPYYLVQTKITSNVLLSKNIPVELESNSEHSLRTSNIPSILVEDAPLMIRQQKVWSQDVAPKYMRIQIYRFSPGFTGLISFCFFL